MLLVRRNRRGKVEKLRCRPWATTLLNDIESDDHHSHHTDHTLLIALTSTRLGLTASRISSRSANSEE
jgi:hypothetical protein